LFEHASHVRTVINIIVMKMVGVMELNHASVYEAATRSAVREARRERVRATRRYYRVYMANTLAPVYADGWHAPDNICAAGRRRGTRHAARLGAVVKRCSAGQVCVVVAVCRQRSDGRVVVVA